MSGSLDGGAGSNSLSGDDDGNVFVITGVGVGTLAGKTTGWSNMQNLSGGAGADGFSFVTGGSLAGTLVGGGGVDTLTGDDAARIYGITGNNQGSLSGLIGGDGPGWRIWWEA
ncbi:MAG: hypothetical protein HC904_12495 [Blastochloris sp.]|nr:hypothetical protein [Blastochloris sp.]